ncbi:MAG: hypothetical protein J6K52_07700 [Clostridia bacterium]|nr:hypothetical protein [Clostridia bacterium]
MYIFRENNNDSESKSFNTKKEFLDYLDNLCEKRELELPKENQAIMPFYERFNDSKGNSFDGISLSGFSNNGSRILGYWTKIPCEN